MQKILVFLLLAFCISCTKQPEKPATPAQNLVTPVQDPDRLILQIALRLPPEHKAKLKKSDQLLWDLKNDQGETLAAGVIEAPAFPRQLAVKANQLRRAIPDNSVLLFSARLMKEGDERKPPQTGQLVVMAGVVPNEKTIENHNVDQKRLAKWEKKNPIMDDQVLTIGAKVEAAFAPSLW